ncbi:hypothetical protein EJB05_49343, partial [Eragrostis curvula]
MESWWALPAWLSSGTAMFVFFNVLVGAVAVMSRGQQGGHGRRLCRCASSMVIGRLRSFSSVLSFSGHTEAEWYYHPAPEAEELPAVDVSAPEPAAGEPPCAHVGATAADVAPVPVAEAQKDGPAAEETGTSLDVPKVCSKQRHAPEPSPPAVAEPAAAAEEPAEEETESVKQRRARGCRRQAEEAVEEKAELNARADLFIQQFREDLKLQRLNSIINYTRALRQRAGAALSLD